MSTREFVRLSGKDVPSAAHVCVVFGGWGGPVQGGEETVKRDSGAAQFAEGVRTLGLTVKDWQGALDGRAMMEQALTFIREKFTPKGKLIIYGYSAGGMNAFELAQELGRRPLDLSMAKGARATQSGKPDVMVDMLITIDAYRRGVNPQDRRVPGNVVRSINIYQQYPQGITGSHGGPSHRKDMDEQAHDCNQDRSKRKEYKDLGGGIAGVGRGGSHAYIDEDTYKVVLQKVEALIVGGPDVVDCKLN